MATSVSLQKDSPRKLFSLLRDNHTFSNIYIGFSNLYGITYLVIFVSWSVSGRKHLMRYEHLYAMDEFGICIVELGVKGISRLVLLQM